MEWLLNLLGLAGGPTAQEPRPGVPPQGGASLPTTASQGGDGSTSAGGRASGPGAMAPEMAKILAASLLADPTKISMPGAVAPARPQPFVYMPMKMTPMGTSRTSLRGY